MIMVTVCVGSSCHLKGSERIVERLQQLIKERKLEDEIILSGSFFCGKCNRTGVTIKVDDDEFIGITPEGFDSFFEQNIMSRIQ